MARGMMTSFAPDWQDESAAKAAYLTYNERVRQTAPAHRFVEWHPGNDWASICAALGMATPSLPFPPREHHRRDAAFLTRRLNLDVTVT